MLKTPLFPLLLFFSTLTSCGFLTRKEALTVNNIIVAINDSLYLMGRQYESLIANAVKEKNYSRLQPARLAYTRFIDSGIQVVSKLNDAGGATELKNAELQLLNIQKAMVEQDFQPFETLNDQSADQTIAALFNSIKSRYRSETDQLLNLEKIQIAYAKKNGFSLKRTALAVNK